jgi:replicative DNA helicase
MNRVTRIHDKASYRTEAEQAVLGLLLLNGALCGRAIRAGGEGLFFDPIHAEIFRVIADKDRAGDLVSPVTVSATMGDHDGLSQLGGGAYIARLAGASPAPSSLKGYIELLADLSHKRRIGDLLADAQAAIARGEDAASHIAARLEAGLIAQAPPESAGPVSMLRAVTGAVEQVRAAYEGDGDAVVRSGIAALDQIVSGFYPGELILVGGRPSMGKTGVALSLALNAAREGHGVCIASLEMNPEALALRALSEQTAQQADAVSYANMRRGAINEAQVASIQAAAKAIADLPITFLPRQFADIGALMAGAKQVQRAMDENLRLMIVDYAQLLTAKGETRYEQITRISNALKHLAGQLNVPVIALSQLSRAVENREDKRPIMSDLRESGQLEQDADTVLFCYRDEYYVERSKPSDHEAVDKHELWNAAMKKARNRLEIIVAKQRQGSIGTAHVFFNPAINRIWEGY